MAQQSNQNEFQIAAQVANQLQNADGFKDLLPDQVNQKIEKKAAEDAKPAVKVKSAAKSSNGGKAAVTKAKDHEA